MIELSFWQSVTIVLVFSFVVIALDEYVLKDWRKRRWQRQADSGDEEKKELLRLASSAKVTEE